VSSLEGLREDDRYREGRTRRSTNTVLLVGRRIKDSLCGRAVLLSIRKVLIISRRRKLQPKRGSIRRI